MIQQNKELMSKIQTLMDQNASMPVDHKLIGNMNLPSSSMSGDFMNQFLKTQHERIQFIGTMGGVSYMQSRELSGVDKINLMKMGIGRGILDRETEQHLLATEPSLDPDIKDFLRCSTLYFKFVVLRTVDS